MNAFRALHRVSKVPTIPAGVVLCKSTFSTTKPAPHSGDSNTSPHGRLHHPTQAHDSVSSQHDRVFDSGGSARRGFTKVCGAKHLREELCAAFAEHGRLYLSCHQWIELANSSELRIRCGLTDHGLSLCGDLTAVVVQESVGANVKNGDIVAHISWDALSMSSADELYHSVWGVVQGEHPVEAAVPGVISAVRTDVRKAENGDWIYELSVGECAADTLLRLVMVSAKYDELCEAQIEADLQREGDILHSRYTHPQGGAGIGGESAR